MDILVFSPNLDLLSDASERLEQRGYSVIGTDDAQAARTILETVQHPLVGLLSAVDGDPASDGWDVARHGRRLDPRIAVGYLSALGHTEWAERGVPGSVLINSSGSAADIPAGFLASCGRRQSGISELQTSALAGMHLAHVIGNETEALREHFLRTPSFIALLEGSEHRFTFANAAYVELVGREVVGRTVLEAFPEVQAQGFVDILKRVYATGEEFVAHGIEFRMEDEGAASRTAYIDLIYRPVRNLQSEISGIFVEGEDLTDRLAAEAKVLKLQNDLIHLARTNAMGLLAGALAHELAQPLASIQNFLSAAEMHAEKEALSPELARCIEGIGSNSQRAGDIVRRLRAMTVRRSLAKKPVDVETALREAVSIACAGYRDAEIRYDLQADAKVRADTIQLQQVLLNLIRNALEAAEANAPSLSFSTTDEGRFVRVCLRDNGPGIAEDVLDRIFDAFATTKEDGMGVGLSLCKMIVETHGGRISARNQGDGGAEFCFTLPKS